MYVISSSFHGSLVDRSFLLRVTSRFEHLDFNINFFVAVSNFPVCYKYIILYCRYVAVIVYIIYRIPIYCLLIYMNFNQLLNIF